MCDVLYQVKGTTSVAQLSLFATEGDVKENGYSNAIEIIIGSGGNTKTEIRNYGGKTVVYPNKPNEEHPYHPLDKNCFKWFWISWCNKAVKFGHGCKVNFQNASLSVEYNKEVNYVGITMYGTHRGDWVFYDSSKYTNIY